MSEKKRSPQLYVDESLHEDIKGLKALRQMNIKDIVGNLFRSEFKTDEFFKFCKEMHKKNTKERTEFKQEPYSFDFYCNSNLEYLKDEYHKTL